MQPDVTQPFAIMGWCRYVIKAPIMNGYRHSGKFVRQELRKGEVVRGNEHFVPTAMKLREKSSKSVTMNATCRARGVCQTSSHIFTPETNEDTEDVKLHS